MDRGDPLALDRDTMRALGYRMVDELVERVHAGTPAPPRMTRAQTEAALGGPAPDQPLPVDEVFAGLGRVLDMTSRNDHPGFFAFIPGAPTWPGALADFAAAAVNAQAINWIGAPGPSQVELTVGDWMRRWFGLPDGAGGVFVSGGSAANMTALAAARETRVGFMRDDIVAYVTDQAHSSVPRAARILGFRPEQVRVLPGDRTQRMRPDLLDQVMTADEQAGRRPLFVAAAAGATSTGAVDPLDEVADVAARHGAWLHVDAAYGGGVILTERGRTWLRGIERADSITVDAHKWLYQPYECGVLLVRDLATLHRSFEITPDYLKDVQSALREPNFADLGLQLTRAARALKVWVSLRYYGVDAFRQAVDRSLDLAAHARERIEASETLELLTPPSLGVLCFRRVVDGADEAALDAINAQLIGVVAASGEAFMTSTRVAGRLALRLVVLNHGTTQAHVDRVLDILETTPVDVPAGSHGSAIAPQDHTHDLGIDQDTGGRFVRGNAFMPDELRAMPLFEGIEDAHLAWVARIAVERRISPGLPLIEQWDTSRELLVIVEGEADVTRAATFVTTLGPGAFVGEIAALEWLTGFSYPRTATVTARTPMRVLVIPDGLVPAIARDIPEVGERLRAKARERLPTL